ncbi:MAG: ADP-forming succinate--CoA ligase subunit beta [candidate division Zixibacteria bacterium]|nr:ADP-forming succinate--CoA ligase subunit beta [candidate division Zixibacteria bacterium]
MNLHEYQAKELFAQAGIPIPKGKVARTPEEAYQIASELGQTVVVKAQVHTGGRGKAGGVKLAQTPEEAKEKASVILGMDIKGYIVEKVLVTEAADITSEAYLSVTLDRESKMPVIIASPAGGIEIEEVAKQNPEKVLKLRVNPLTGLLPYHSRQVSGFLYADKNIRKQAETILKKLYALYFQADLTLAEINPLVVTKKGELIALDAKVTIDDNALVRHPEFEKYKEFFGAEKIEEEAKKAGLSFVKLDGSIGCIVNGAGLAMATMDLVKFYGGRPANFLDIGGSSNPEKVIAAMKIILADPNVKAICFNIFGGITRGDDVATGIVKAVNTLKPKVPIAIRLVGTNEDLAKEILSKVNLNVFSSMTEVVKKAIELSKAA